jgi:hypothetical protein
LVANGWPIHPSYGTLNRRLDSYKRFDLSNHPVGIKKLAEAGLYYEGLDDKVRCFWCDGAMEKWEEGDNAWIEHAK